MNLLRRFLRLFRRRPRRSPLNYGVRPFTDGRHIFYVPCQMFVEKGVVYWWPLTRAPKSFLKNVRRQLTCEN